MTLLGHVINDMYNDVITSDISHYDATHSHSFAHELLNHCQQRRLLILIDMGKIKPAQTPRNQILPHLLRSISSPYNRDENIHTARRLIDAKFEIESITLLRIICDCVCFDTDYLGVTLLLQLARHHTIDSTWDLVVLEKLFDLGAITLVQARILLGQLITSHCIDIVILQPPIITRWFKEFPGVGADVLDPHLPIAYLDVLLDMGLVFDCPARSRMNKCAQLAISARDRHTRLFATKH